MGKSSFNKGNGWVSSSNPVYVQLSFLYTPKKKKRRTWNVPHCGKRKLFFFLACRYPVWGSSRQFFRVWLFGWCCAVTLLAFASTATQMYFVVGVKGAKCRVSGSQDECQNGSLARIRCKFNQPINRLAVKQETDLYCNNMCFLCLSKGVRPQSCPSFPTISKKPLERVP